MFDKIIGNIVLTKYKSFFDGFFCGIDPIQLTMMSLFNLRLTNNVVKSKFKLCDVTLNFVRSISYTFFECVFSRLETYKPNIPEEPNTTIFVIYKNDKNFKYFFVSSIDSLYVIVMLLLLVHHESSSSF